ncbi:MAG: hypothetical protein KJ770_07370, partial [Actinobacteria bacterium]|nr:hypothetical protein [Actinomycetota bacterium]
DELNLKSSGMCSSSSSGSRSGSHLSSLTGVDKRVFPPDAFHLNLCAYYSYLKNRQTNYNLDDYGLAPLYVREFAPFKT